MLKKLLLFAFFMFFVTSASFAKEDVFFYKFDLGLKLLQIEQKTGMVVIDSDHCGFCKKLKEVTFKNESVSDILNKYYISIEVNLDNSNEILHYKKYTLTPQTFAAGLKVRGTPTLVFLDEKADILTLLPGYAPPEKMLSVLKYIGQRIFEKKIKFGDYLKKPVEDKFKGSDKVIEISLEDVEFVAKNDPFVRVYAFSEFKTDKIPSLTNISDTAFRENLPNLSKSKKYILIGEHKEELLKLGEDMLSMGFPTILIYHISSNNKQ